MDSIIEHIQATCVEKKLYLPIQSIDNIPCHVYVQKRISLHYDLCIQTIRSYHHGHGEGRYTILDGREDNDREDNHTYYMVVLKDSELDTIKDILESLHFDHVRSKFQTTPVVNWNVLASTKVKMNYYNCEVCSYPTNVIQESCGHRVCYPCLDKPGSGCPSCTTSILKRASPKKRRLNTP